MNKKNYVTKHKDMISVLKNGMKDVKKLDKLGEEKFYAWKEYHKINDKRLRLVEKGKLSDAELMFWSLHKSLIKAYEKEIIYEKCLLSAVVEKKVWVLAKELEDKRKNKKPVKKK